MNEHITEYLNDYVKLSNPQFAVLITGKWGCGKTFYIKEQLKRWEDEFKIEDDDSITIKPLYLSLNGLSSTKAINERLSALINPFLHSKVAKVGKKVLQGLLKTALKINLDDIKDNDDVSGSVSFDLDALGIFTSDDDKIKGKKLIVFDDLERCNVPMEELFGYINNFVEHSKCNVLLIADEIKIVENAKRESLSKSGDKKDDEEELPLAYKNIKEKLVGQTFEYKSDVREILQFFYDAIDAIPFTERLDDEIILGVYYSSESENLRSLRQVLLSYHRFFKHIPDEIIQGENFQVYFKHLTYYFLLVGLEYKQGVTEVEEYQASSTTVKKEGALSRIERKYAPLQNKKSILHSTKVFHVEYIYQFIAKGYLSKEIIEEQINSSELINSSLPEWKEFVYWNNLTDERFKELFQKTWNAFTSGAITEYKVLLHNVGVFLQLSEKQLIEKKTEYVVKVAKRNIDRIILGLLARDSTFKLDSHSISVAGFGFGYINSSSLEFIEIAGYFNDEFQKKSNILCTDRLKDHFENLNNDNVHKTFELLQESLPDFSTSIENSSIFKNVNGIKLSKCVLELNSESIWFFIKFLNYRYYPEKRYSNGSLEEYHKDDLKCLQDCLSVFERKTFNRNVPSHFAKREFRDKLVEIVEKLKG